MSKIKIELEEYESLKREINNLEAENKGLQIQVNAYDGNIRKVVSENAQLKSQIETQAASIKLLQEELKSWRESEKAWRNGRYVSEYCRMEQEVEQLKTEKSQIGQTNLKLIDENAKHIENYTSITNEHRKLKSELKDYVSYNIRVSEENYRLNAEIGRLRQILHNYDKFDPFTVDVQSIKDENQNLKVKLVELEKENKDLRFQIMLFLNGRKISEEFKRGYEQAQADFKYMQSSGKKWWRIFK